MHSVIFKAHYKAQFPHQPGASPSDKAKGIIDSIPKFQKSWGYY
jgi:hypothetical protein